MKRLWTTRVTRRCAGLAAAVAAVTAVALLLSACGSDPLAAQYRAGSDKNYIANDGSISEYAPANRDVPVSFSGATTQSTTFDSATTRGKVTVVNFWYAGCAPCRAEAPVLKQAQAALPSASVVFIGVNVRDEQATAQSFEQTFHVDYSSILDVAGGSVQLAFAGKIPPAAVPTTIVLDRSGRVAARVLGRVPDATTLTSIVTKAVGES